MFDFDQAFASAPRVDPTMWGADCLLRPQISRWTRRKEYGSVEYRPRDWVTQTDLGSLEKVAHVSNFQPEAADVQHLDGYIGVSEATSLAGEQVGRGAVLRALEQANTRELKINALKFGPPPPDDLKACRIWRACFPGADRASKYEAHNRGANNWGRTTATKFPDMGPGVFFGVARVGHHSDQFLEVRRCYDTKVPCPGDYYAQGNVLNWRELTHEGETIYSDVAVGQDGGFVFTSALANCYADMVNEGRNVAIKWDLQYDFPVPDVWGVVRKNLFHNDEVVIAVGPDVPEEVSICSALYELRGMQVEANRTRNDNIWNGVVQFTEFAYGDYTAFRTAVAGCSPKSTLGSNRTDNISSIINKRRSAAVVTTAKDHTPIPRPPIIKPLRTRARVIQNLVTRTDRWRAEICELAWAEGYAPFYQHGVGWVIRKHSAPPPPFDVQAYLDFVSPSMRGTDVSEARSEFDGYLSD